MALEEIEDWGTDSEGNPIPAPEVEPELCEEGFNGFECEPNWNGEFWFCKTCNEYI